MTLSDRLSALRALGAYEQADLLERRNLREQIERIERVQSAERVELEKARRQRGELKGTFPKRPCIMKWRFLPGCSHRRIRYCCTPPCGHLHCPDCGLFWDEGACR